MKIIYKPFRLLIYWWGKIRTKCFRLAKSSKLLKQKARSCSAFVLPVTAAPILTSPFNLKQFTFTSSWNRTETKLRREWGREKERKKKETLENCLCFKATRTTEDEIFLSGILGLGRCVIKTKHIFYTAFILPTSYFSELATLLIWTSSFILNKLATATIFPTERNTIVLFKNWNAKSLEISEFLVNKSNASGLLNY